MVDLTHFEKAIDIAFCLERYIIRESIKVVVPFKVHFYLVLLENSELSHGLCKKSFWIYLSGCVLPTGCLAG